MVKQLTFTELLKLLNIIQDGQVSNLLVLYDDGQKLIPTDFLKFAKRVLNGSAQGTSDDITKLISEKFEEIASTYRERLRFILGKFSSNYSKDTFISSRVALRIDIDKALTFEELQNFIQSLPIQPNVALKTLKGWHLFYIVDKDITADDKDWLFYGILAKELKAKLTDVDKVDTKHTIMTRYSNEIYLLRAPYGKDELKALAEDVFFNLMIETDVAFSEGKSIIPFDSITAEEYEQAWNQCLIMQQLENNWEDDGYYEWFFKCVKYVAQAHLTGNKDYYENLFVQKSLEWKKGEPKEQEIRYLFNWEYEKMQKAGGILYFSCKHMRDNVKTEFAELCSRCPVARWENGELVSKPVKLVKLQEQQEQGQKEKEEKGRKKKKDLILSESEDWVSELKRKLENGDYIRFFAEKFVNVDGFWFWVQAYKDKTGEYRILDFKYVCEYFDIKKVYIDVDRRGYKTFKIDLGHYEEVLDELDKKTLEKMLGSHTFEEKLFKYLFTALKRETLLVRLYRRTGWLDKNAKTKNAFLHPALSEELEKLKIEVDIPFAERFIVNDKDKQHKMVKEILEEGKLLAVKIALACASLFLERGGFVVLDVGERLIGKTFTSTLACNLFYNSKDFITTYTTKTAAEVMAKKFMHLPLLFDETALSFDDHLQSLIFMFYSGKGKLRSDVRLSLNINDLRNVVFLTSERELDLDRLGAFRRFLTILPRSRQDYTEVEFDEKVETFTGCGIDYIKFLIEKQDEIKPDGFLSDFSAFGFNEAVEKSVIMLEKFYNASFVRLREKLREVFALQHREAVRDVFVIFAERLLNWFGTYYRYFEGSVVDNYAKPVYGFFEKQEGKLYIYTKHFDQFCIENNFPKRTVLEWAKEVGILETKFENRFSQNKHLPVVGASVPTYCFNLTKLQQYLNNRQEPPKPPQPTEPPKEPPPPPPTSTQPQTQEEFDFYMYFESTTEVLNMIKDIRHVADEFKANGLSYEEIKEEIKKFYESDLEVLRKVFVFCSDMFSAEELLEIRKFLQEFEFDLLPEPTEPPKPPQPTEPSPEQNEDVFNGDPEEDLLNDFASWSTDKHDKTSAKPIPETPPAPVQITQIKVNSNFKVKVVKDLNEIPARYNEPLWLDIETDVRTQQLVLISFYQKSFKDTVYVYVSNDKQKVKEFVKRFKELGGHALEFDLTRLGFTYSELKDKVIHDTLLLSKLVLYDRKLYNKGYSLDELLRDVLNIDYQFDKKKMQKSFTSLTITEDQLRYASCDVFYLPQLYERLRQGDYSKIVYELDTEALKVVVDTSQRGMPFVLEKAKEELLRIQNELMQIKNQLPAKLNPNSSEQVKRFLNTKDAKEETLRALILSNHPKSRYAELILQAKALDKLQGYVKKYINKAKTDGGRVRGQFWTTTAQSGRMSCESENLQQVPHSLRDLFGFDENSDKTLVIADFPQIELRLSAVIWHEENFLNAFRQGIDLHKQTASIIYNKPIGEVTKDERQTGKSANFGLIYGMTPTGFRAYCIKNGINISEQDAENIRTAFLNYYKDIEKKHNEVDQVIKSSERYENSTWLGRRYITKDFNKALNYQIQGSGADLFKYTIVELKKNYPELHITNLVHDEIVVEADERDAKDVAEIVKKHMEQAWDFCTAYANEHVYKVDEIKLECEEPAISKNWIKD